MSDKYPLQQGALDHLCGLYAILNAIKCAGIDLTNKDERKVFKKLLEFCDQKWGLLAVMNGGTTRKQFSKLLDASNVVLMKRNQVFLRVSRPLEKNASLDELWNTIGEQLSDRQSVIVGTTDRLDHWTTVSRITEKQMCLFDSDGRKHFNKANCAAPSFPKDKREDRTVLHPREVFVLNVVNLSEITR